MALNRIPIAQRLDRPAVRLAVDLVLLTILDGDLHVVMAEREEHPYGGQFALPGMILLEDQPLLERAINRVLFDQVGDIDVRPEQFFTFSDLQRDPRGWVASVGYLALAPAEWLMRLTEPGCGPVLVKVALADQSDRAELNFEGLALNAAFDHAAMIAKAVRHLRTRLEGSMHAFDLLPGEFTLLELQEVHEVILDRDLAKQAFRKRLAGRIFPDGRRLEATGEKRGGRHRPAELYALGPALS